MNEMVISQTLPPMTDAGMAKIFAFEEKMKELPQLAFVTKHVIHAGVYSRTMMLPAGAALTGVRIKIPTQLVISGHCVLSVGDKAFEIMGYDAVAAPAGRKVAYFAHTDTYITMMFGTDVKSVGEAEAQATDDIDQLASHKDSNSNIIVITGD